MMSSENQNAESGYQDEAKALDALSSIMQKLTPLQQSDRERICATVMTFFNLSGINRLGASSHPAQMSQSNYSASAVQFSTDRTMTPKQFLMEKQPKTDVERVACLAYYLTHFRDLPYFKTLDITKLNTEAAQPKLSNPAKATGNAVEYGYLAQATKGNRQLSAAGELFIQALPDREAAKAAMANSRPKRAKNGKKRTEKEEIQ